MISQHRDLRTGQSPWLGRRGAVVKAARLTRSIKTDVLVIGAGITGAMVAQALAADGLDVVVADRRGPAKGSTSASTALIQYEVDTPLTLLKRRIGSDKAERAWRRSRLAVDSLAGTLAELGIPHLERRATLYLAGNVLDPAGLQREMKARRAAGLDGDYLTRGPLRDRFGIMAEAALISYGNFATDPRKATLALLADAQRNKARLYCPLDITEITTLSRGVRALTEQGLEIDARHLVFATGYEMPKYVPQRGHSVISTWAIATAPQRSRLWPGEAMIWQAADPYLYVRTTPDGRVICGGEDEEFADAEARDARIASKTKTLMRKLKRLLPALDTRIEYAWAGSFGQSRTGLPSIGEIPGMPNCWAALGYGGNGTTYARIAAEIIRNAIQGNHDRDADLYGFPTL